MNEKTTAQVADMIGTSRTSLNTFLSRHPDLRPAKRLKPSGDLLWTDEEIERLKEAKAKAKNGRPRKGGAA
jgi:hypothetical protein